MHITGSSPVRNGEPCISQKTWGLRQLWAIGAGDKGEARSANENPELRGIKPVAEKDKGFQLDGVKNSTWVPEKNTQHKEVRCEGQ